MTVRGLLRALSFLCGLALIHCHAVAGEPSIRNLDLRGLQIGSTTTLSIDGDDFGPAPKLLLPFPAKVDFKSPEKPNDKRAVFAVTLEGDVVPGYYSLRMVTDEGVSLPQAIAVDRLPQQTIKPEPITLPAALHGSFSGGSISEVRLAGKAGQKLKIEVEAQRLGGKLRPVLHLYNARKRQLAWSWTTPALAGDTRLEATLPEDGEYFITLHDAEYAAPAPGYFRLRVGEWAGVDQVFPPVVGQGQSQAVELLGTAGPMKVELPATGPGVLPLIWPKNGAWSGARPSVLVSTRAESLEMPAGDAPQSLPGGPVGVCGRLSVPLEEDRYRLAVTPGMRLRLEVFAERLGSPLDAALIVRNEKGDLLQRTEDGPGTVDPVLDYAVPANVPAIFLCVADAAGRGGPRGVYRLTVDPLSAGGAANDYSLFTPAQRIVLPIGGRMVMPIFIERRGYAGAVELSASNLPAGISCESASIPYAGDGALITLIRGDSPCEPTITSWHGRVPEAGERNVIARGHPLERIQPWMAGEIAVAPSTAKAAEFQVAWRDLPEDAGLLLASKRPLPIKLVRPEGKNSVRLSLVTSQAPPANGQADAKRTLRVEKPAELAAGAIDGELTVLVPQELSSPTYDVTVQAELLNEAKKVIATSFAPVRRMPVKNPLSLKVASARIEAVTDPKMPVTIKLQGEVDRLDGSTGDVALTITGLPAGVRADPVTVKADAREFAFNVIVPPNLAPGEFNLLRLTGVLTPDPKQPQRVKSKEVELTLVVMIPAK